MKTLPSVLTLVGMGIRQYPGRILYLVLTIAVTVTAWLGLSAMASPFLAVKQRSATHNTLTVSNARASNHMLPEHYARRLAKIPGVKSFEYVSVQLVQCGSGQTITLNALGGSNVAADLQQDGFSAAAVHRWQSDRLGILLGVKAASDCGWTQGMGIRPPTVLQRKPLALHVSGVASPTSEWKGTSAVVHYDYINRSAPMFGADTVMNFSVTAKDPRHSDMLAKRIEKVFAHADPPVAAYPDVATKNAWSRFGKVQNLLALVMAGLFVCCALVLVSVLAHTAAQRRRYIAMLQVIGYPRWLLLTGFALEHACIVVLGTVSGLVVSHFVPHATSWLLHGLFAHVKPPVWAYATLPAWLTTLWLVALVAPSTLLWHVHPTDCREA